MNKDLISAVEALEMEAGISKETMFETIEKALREEYKAQYGNSKEEAQDYIEKYFRTYHSKMPLWCITTTWRHDGKYHDSSKPVCDHHW